MKSIHKYIVDKVESGEKLHFTLVDPDRVSKYEELEKLADEVKHYGSDAFLLGGSIGVTPSEADETARVLRKTGLPIVIFPGNINCITRYADAILYMVLMNSLDAYYLIEAQVAAAPIVKKYGLETLPTAYIVVYGDTSVAHIGRVYPIPISKPEIALAYSYAAEMLGMKYVYLEAGSGSQNIVPPQMISVVKKNTKLVVIVGGGVRNSELAERVVESGADIVVTGTIVEHEPSKLREIISVVKKHTFS